MRKKVLSNVLDINNHGKIYFNVYYLYMEKMKWFIF